MFQFELDQTLIIAPDKFLMYLDIIDAVSN